ncbi:MAG: iron export ABC transporter permease subunit FetB [Planctomycetaceae bacterium]
MEYLKLEYWQVAFAAVLIIVNGGISIWLRLGLERSLAVGTIRMVVQLLLLGLILQWVFNLDRWYVVLLIACVMTTIAGFTAAKRSRRRYNGMRLDTTIAVWGSSWLVTAYAIVFVVSGIDKWYQPQYLIPLLGMVLGNTLNGISVGLGTFTETAWSKHNEIETLLSLGATGWEACEEPIRHALRTGMTPIINSMMIVGLVSLPGMMTGQMLSGTDPVEAVKYQIVIFFLIASATALGTTAAVLLSFRRLFNSDHQFQRSKLIAAD